MIASTNTHLENQGDIVANERTGDPVRRIMACYEKATPRELTYRLAELDQE